MAQTNQNQRAEQERIKAAVSDVSESLPGVMEDSQTQSVDSTAGMQPSMLSAETEAPQQAPIPEEQAYAPQSQAQYNYAPESYQDYSQEGSQYSYAPQASAESSDVISEIAEQIVSEKTSLMKNEIDKIKDFRTTTEAKIEGLAERLQRIEKTIDRLQLSILQKVGDYVSNVESLKTELVETQKSFKALHGKSSSQHPQHQQSQPHPHQPDHKHKKR